MTVEELLASLESRGLKLAIAESLTGGLVAATFTAPAGASKVFLGSITAYQTVLKHQLLGVSNQLLEQQGAVDPEVAAQMAGGVRSKLANKCGLEESSVVGVSTTGFAGPESQGGIEVGTVFIALAGLPNIGEVVYAHKLQGDRTQVREKVVDLVLEHLSEHF